MAKIDLLGVLAGKWEDGTRPKDLFAQYLAPNPSDYLTELLEGLKSDAKRVQGGCAELASLLSETHPQLLFPHFDKFLANLSAKEPILRWEAACTVGNLVALDKKGKVRDYVDVLSDHLQDKSIVLQGHCVRALAKIAQAHADLAPSILDALIGARLRFPGNRIGYLVEAMAVFARNEKLLKKVRAFVEPLSSSDIRPVATKARKILKQIDSAPRRKR